MDLELPGGPPRSASVTTASSIIVAPLSRERRKLIIVNNGAKACFLCRGQTAVANAGIRLNPTGSSLVDEPDNLGRMYRGSWSAITASDTTTLTISEE